jgi:hypothetical protein
VLAVTTTTCAPSRSLKFLAGRMMAGLPTAAWAISAASDLARARSMSSSTTSLTLAH